MSLSNPFSNFAFGKIFESALPDFVLAFTFFTALTYAVLGKRIEHQHAAVAASAALGMALSIGLVWWEQRQGLSIKDLGPLAVGFALIALAGVLYQAIRQTGGSWSGAGIAIGTSLLVGWAMGVRWPVAEQIVQTVIIVTLIAGVMAFLLHHGARGGAVAGTQVLIRREIPSVRHDMRDLQEDQIVSDLLSRRLGDIENRTDQLHQHPAEAADVLLQLNRMLPREGWLTQRLANLRAKAYQARQGHIARITEFQHLISKLPPEAKRKASQELAARYQELNLDQRLDRLDKAAAANEKKIRDLTQQARAYMASHDYRRLHDVLEAARKLQRQNSTLFQIINRTDKKLTGVAQQVAKNAPG
jgi:hypothetical protein